MLSLNYTVPRPGGDAWLGYAVFSDSVIEPLGAANVVGKGLTLGVRRIFQLPGSGSFNHSVVAGADYKDLKERINAGDSSLSSPLRYAPMKLDYNATHSSERGTTSIGLGVVLNLRGVSRRELDCFDTGNVDQFACKREGADGSFALGSLDLSHTHTPLPDVLGKWQAQWRLSAQFTNQPLEGSEQFSIGGASTVRGYFESEAVGDLGAHVGLELRSPNWRNHVVSDEGAGWVDDLGVQLFLEGGQVRTINAGQAQDRSTLAGAGMGLRLKALRRLSAQIDVAWPLKGTDATRQYAPRAHARLGMEF